MQYLVFQLCKDEKLYCIGIREQKEKKLLASIEEIYQKSRFCYGSTGVAAELKK